MDISVVIVNWNTKKLLEDCLKSIFKFTAGVSFEVIVVDNGSKDGSLQIVKKKFPKVRLIPNRTNLGFTKANNQGIKKAQGDYIMLLNSDTYLIENSFKKLIEKARYIEGSTLLKVEPLKNSLGTLGPQLLNEDRSIQQSAGFFPHLPQVFWWMSFIDDLPFGSLLKPFHVDHDSFYKKDREVDWITAAAILVPREIIQRVGPFDEKIFMYGEEIEWCYRIKKAHLKVYFSPITKIVHIGGGSLQKVRTQAFIGEFKGLDYFYRKYKSQASLHYLHLLLKIGTLLRIFVFGILGRKEATKSYVEVLKMGR